MFMYILVKTYLIHRIVFILLIKEIGYFILDLLGSNFITCICDIYGNGGSGE